MKKNILFLILSLFTLSFFQCGNKEHAYTWNLPEGVSPPPVPEWNPLTKEKVELGRRLFYDKSLSQDQTMSCSSCHFQEFGFTDRKKTPRGIPSGKGELHPRNSQQLGNAAYYNVLTWANPVLKDFESQNAVPLFFTANAVREMGLEGDAYLDRLRKDPVSLDLFRKAFPKEKPDEAVTERNMRLALASFQRTLVSFDSPYDRFSRGDEMALNDQAKKGMELFNGEKMKCSKCHPAPYFADSTVDKDKIVMHNNGLYSAKDYAKKQLGEKGLMEFTLNQKNEGTFRVPTLRNAGVTFPYMHDGSIGCDDQFLGDEDGCARQALGRVIDHYAKGGKKHPGQDKKVAGFTLESGEKEALIEFLLSLTDRNFLTNPAFSNPFAKEKTTASLE